MKPGDLLHIDETLESISGICRELTPMSVVIPGGAHVIVISDSDKRYDDCCNVLYDGHVVVIERKMLCFCDAPASRRRWRRTSETR